MMDKPKGGKRYEKSWSEILAMVDREIDEGRQDGRQILAGIWADIAAKNHSSRRLRAYYAKVGIPLEKDTLPGERVVVHDGAYSIVPFDHACHEKVIATLAEYIASHREQIDCIVELGSGTGRNLFNLFNAAGEQMGGELEFHACELTNAGREVTKRLHRLVPGMNLSVHAFDYFKPDFSFLKGRPNVLFFTVFSVEQIPVLGRVVVDGMREQTGSCSCFHFEPIGWQYEGELCDWRRRRSTPLRTLGTRWFRRLLRASDSLFSTRLRDTFSGIKLEREDIGKRDRVSRNAAVWSARTDYNTNLVSLLRGLEADGEITIEREEVNVHGDNPFNPASMVLWRSDQEPRGNQ